MFDQEQVTANLDNELIRLTRMLAEAVDAYDLPRVKRLSERRDEVLDNRSALHGNY
jgi:hypothetical protein